MICRELNCLFVHIPKTAGQSIERVLLARMGLDWEQRSTALLRTNPDPACGPPRLAHLTACEYLAHGYVTASEFARMFKFAFVRNPWDRLVSEYHFRAVPRPTSFREFVLERFPGPDRDDYARGWDPHRHVVPQSRFLCDASGRCKVDFVGRFERLDSDFQEVTARLGLGVLSLPHTNRARRKISPPRGGRVAQLLTALKRRTGTSVAEPPRRPYWDYYDIETRDFVATYYAEDIAMFGYRFRD